MTSDAEQKSSLREVSHCRVLSVRLRIMLSIFSVASCEIFSPNWATFKAVVRNLFWMNADLPHTKTSCLHVLSTFNPSFMPSSAPNPRAIP